jgi:hypothetical protein
MSTRDPIEDLFRDNQHGLNERPRDLIWDRIEERLDEKPVLKKKTKVWKYVVAASVFAGISLAGLYFLNPNENPSKMESIVLMEPVDMNEEKATEILDQIEAESTAIVTTKSQAPAPEIMEEELKNPISIKQKINTAPQKEFSYQDEVIMAAPAAEIQTETKLNIPLAKQKQEEISAYGTGQFTQKEQTKEIGNLDFDGRRMGNMAEDIQMKYIKNTHSFIDVSTSNQTIRYDLISTTDSIHVFENETIKYPKQIIFRKYNDTFTIIYSGKDSKRKSKESLEIQEFIEAHKEQIIQNFGF